MADIMCRWRNPSAKTVCKLVSVLPKEQMSSERFRDIMDNQTIFSEFFKTAYQLACQLGLYCENDGLYTPRFTQDINEKEANDYLSYWIRWYYAPNPYSKSLKTNDTPKYLVWELIKYVCENGPSPLRVALEKIYEDEMGNLDIVSNAINNYSKVLQVDNQVVSLTFNYMENINDMPNREDRIAFFKNFDKSKRGYGMPLDLPQQLIYFGAPGTGKSFTIDKMTDENNSIRTTFHPDTDYSSFVGAYKPTMADMGISYVSDGFAKFAKESFGHPGKEKKIVYKFVPQAFMKAYVAAWKDLDNPYFLVIEEINRGNCAQIFGDLFQLLDRNSSGSSTYPIQADEDIAQFLAEDSRGFALKKSGMDDGLTEEQQEAIRSFTLVKDTGKIEKIGPDILSGKKLLLPPNLYIWATMNTSDQSLFPIDSAFKRRWNWEYVPIDYHAKEWQFEVAGNRYNWSDFLLLINPKIHQLTQSSDKQIGYFFAKPDKKTDPSLRVENNLISEKIFLNKVLFYLWSDVLKDFDPNDNIFRDSETGETYVFSDFFPTSNGKLAEFVEKLGITPVGSEESYPSTNELF